MKYTATLLIAVWPLACGQGEHRNAEVVAAEEFERRKPLLSPPGGMYYAGAEIRVLNFSAALEYSTGAGFQALNSETLTLKTTGTLTVRDRQNPGLATAELYTIVDHFPALEISPPAGTFGHAVTVALKSPLKNSRIEISQGGDFAPYDAEAGIAVPATKTFSVRQCSGTECSPAQELLYTIHNVPVITAPRLLTKQEIAGFGDQARQSYSQTLSHGLRAFMDEAKLRVLHDATLMPASSLRQRFLSQDNTVAAAEACTIVARYLYTQARRITTGGAGLAAMPDFPFYYIRHIASGDITVDAAGRNFVWLVNGAALVTPYLPADAAAPFDFSRGSIFPTDYSLIDRLAVAAPPVALLRDGPSGVSHTHTFLAIKDAGGYKMIDTYFPLFTGIELKASAGQGWPFAYRFGPAGSRYVHFVYGY